MFSIVRSLRVGVLLVYAAGLLGSMGAFATSITYSVTYSGAGNRWQYDYTVINDGSLPGSADIEGFQIFFDYNNTENLDVVGGPAGWDLVRFQPEADLFLDGVFDGLAVPGPGIPQGISLAGFSIAFDWLSSGTPGSQPFEIYAASGFSVLETGGVTSSAAAVPAPSGLWLLGTAMAGLGVFRNRLNSGAGAKPAQIGGRKSAA